MPSHPHIKRGLVAVIAISAAAALGGCEDVLKDPTFRLWCADDQLCSWKTDAGRISRAPTWHEDDFGVAFVETPTRISQVLQKTPRCMLFTSVSDVEPSAQMTIELDFDGDGKVDATYPIPQAKWREEKTLISAPDVYGPNATFSLHKKGPGKAVLAEMRVQERTDCDRSAIPPVKDLNVGQACNDDAQCTTGICEQVCMECAIFFPHTSKSPCGAKDCTRREDVCRSTATYIPLQCAPGKGLADTGAVCTQNEDCRSAQCDGARVNRLPVTASDGTVACRDTSVPKDGTYAFSVFAGRCR